MKYRMDMTTAAAKDSGRVGYVGYGYLTLFCAGV